ncbi:GspH/FimT family pseudopilin [Thiocapsa bogorovii]|uniref:GspH/FimT family pseudopilin n=1 Tax=Thiocapsa bogorovii TaxID=521689 RepID=UPI001E28EDB8|nr:GspH/FimT family pseudopilin [Thiocapsa bogorovii]UHD17899.1 GspH/FimT family pseudopilin [Thiocapsa bogorovii]
MVVAFPEFPCPASPARNACGGFTLLELMVTVAIAAIVLTLGVPSFRDLIQNNRATTQANALVTALSLARSEAVKRGQHVSICPSTDQATCTGGTVWDGGWIIFVDTNASDDTTANPVVGEVLRVEEAMTGVATFSGPAHVRYRAAGDVVKKGTFSHKTTGCTGKNARTIDVGVTGRISVIRSGC